MIAALLLLVLPVFTTSRVLPTAAQTTQDRKAEADGAALQEANRLLEQGLQQYQTSQIEAALQSWQQALKLYRELKDRSGEGNALDNLGTAYASLGDYPKAIEYQQQSLAIFRNLKDRSGEGVSLNNLGNVYNSLGDYSKAIEYHQQSLAIKREIKDRLGEGQSLGNLGSVYYQLGDYAKAIEYYQQSLAIARELKDQSDEAGLLNNLGVIYESLGDYPKAIEYNQQSLAIAQELRDRLGEENSLGNLGNAYDSLGDYTKAIDYYQQSLAIAREVKDRSGEGNALGNLGIVYKSLGDYPKAIEYHQQSLAIKRDLKDRLGEGNSLNNLGIVYDSLGDYTKAIDYYQQSLAIAREIKARSGEGLALGNIGGALLSAGRPTEAEAPLRAAIQIAETLRERLQDTDKVSLADIQRNPYTDLQRVLVAQNKPEQALEIAERGRARSFIELLAKRQNRRPGNPQPIAKPASIAEIRQIAKAHNATLVQYSVINDQSLYIWVVQPTGDITFRSVDLKSILPEGGSLSEYVRAVRSDAIGVRGLRAKPSANAPGPAQKSDYLKALHHLLIEPIASLLPSDPDQRVIFLPQDSLFLVPFAALQDANGKYLIEQHTILTAPSIQVLQLTQQQKQPGSTTQPALIVGNPTMPSVSIDPGDPAEPLPDLPGAEAEAKAIAQFLKVPVLTGDQATETRVKQQMTQARLIHLATHGLLDDRRGIGSAIAFAPSGTDNGLLTAEEILDLRLIADLVVLSACDTGRGKITGDGVIGLSRSLISAGAPSVLVSLWAVPDAPTASLMQAFYRNLQQNPDKAQALRQAMLTTMQQTPAPRDWAAFTLIGEP